MLQAAVIRQPSVGEDHERVTELLSRTFGEMRTAVSEQRPVVAVLDDRDLLGQGTVADAALATAMLGLVRAFALEGARSGWRVNAVTHRGEQAGVEEMVGLLAASALSGQLIRSGSEHLGRVWP